MTAFLAGLLDFPALAANQVPELTVDVALRNDGSAYITQEFHAYTDEGTEFYLDYLDSGVLSITDFLVSDENGSYEVLPEGAWDVDASFEEKAGKCGLLPIDGGVELCWGVTEYGERRYAVEYVLHGLVGSYTDTDGFNYRFVNADMNFFPTNAVVTIRNQDGAPLTDKECDVWAFGFDGQIQFEDGVIHAWTESALDGGANMTVMVALQKGVLSPERRVDDSFETVKERAFEGSGYEKDSVDFLTIVLAVFFLLGTVAVFIVIYNGVQKTKRKKLLENASYFRDAPNGGDLNVSFVLAKDLDFCPDDSLMGARILRLITLGSLVPENTEIDEKDVSLRLAREPHQGDAYDEALYSFLQAAAGADGVLQPKELGAFCQRSENGENLAKFMDQCERDGKLALVRKGCLKGAVCNNMKDLTAAGRWELGELLGLKRYLLDFSLLAERNVNETFLWQEYMVYAMLLGVAKQVMDQLKILYPGQLPQIEQYARYVGCAYSYDYLLYGAVERERMRAREEQAARFSGSGGKASFGGGGGFLGGGSGGIR